MEYLCESWIGISLFNQPNEILEWSDKQMTFIWTNHELTGNQARKWLHSKMKILLSNPNKLQTTVKAAQ